MAKKATSAKRSAKRASSPAKAKSAAKTTKAKSAAKTTGAGKSVKSPAVKKAPAAKKKVATQTVTKAKTAGKKVAAKTVKKARAKTPPKVAKKAIVLRIKLPKSPLSKKETAEFHDMLLAKRRTLLGDMTGMEAEALRGNSDIGDQSSMPVHMADIGTDNYEQEFTLGLLESERQLIREIDESLEQMVQGAYGVCMGTGESISKARLRAKPWAKYSIAYVRKIEQGLIRVPAKDYGALLDDDDSA